MQRSILTFVVAIHIAALLFALTPARAGSWETSGFRTANGQLVRLGMTKEEVRRDAGKPLTGKDKPPSTSSKKRGEIWIYKGSDGYYAVTFQRSRVAKIEVTPFRGY